MTTYHAIQRTQERAGHNIKNAARFIENAIKRGKDYRSFESIEREYLRHEERKQGCTALAYNSFCFILSNDGICITMFALPEWFSKTRTKTNTKSFAKSRVRKDLFLLESIDTDIDNQEDYAA